MIKIKTLSGSIEHLTDLDMEVTLCGRKIYSSWIDTYDDDDITLCKRCKKELDVDGNENKGHVESIRATKRKKWRMATWEN